MLIVTRLKRCVWGCAAVAADGTPAAVDGDADDMPAIVDDDADDVNDIPAIIDGDAVNK